MRKIIFISLSSFFSIIVFVYVVFASFLLWNKLNSSNQKPFEESIFSTSSIPHQLTLVDDGLTSLALRLKMIEKAKKSIELEFFIFDLDFSTRLLTQKLIEKSKKGITVRLLIDTSPSIFELNPLYAKLLNERGIKVKYYNRVPPIRFLSVQHRTHRKLLIIDDTEALTGGRNIADEYFNLHSHYNFLDSDILIKGEIVKDIKKSFDLYWDSDFTLKPVLSEIPNETKIKSAIDFISPNKNDKNILREYNKLSDELINNLKTYSCPEITYVTDYPGIEESNRRVFQFLVSQFNLAQHEVWGETPYFIMKAGGVEILESLNQKGVQTNILTNSLYSTDAYYTVSAMWLELSNLTKKNLKLYSYNGKTPLLNYSIPLTIGKRWGIHSKRAVIDEDISLIGTYNVDPRSANFNSEIIVACKGNKEFAQAMKKSILDRQSRSSLILSGEMINDESIFKQATSKQKILFYLTLPLVYFFGFLL